MTIAENASVKLRLMSVRLLAMDVDGVLTDGGIILDHSGAEVKRFHVADGLGLQLLRSVGVQVAWISGRASTAVESRASELGIDHLLQGVANKAAVLEDLCLRVGVHPDFVAYIGDDLNDLPAFEVAGVTMAPANAVPEVRAEADLVLERSGGSGAVREACAVILKTQGRWSSAVAEYLEALRQV